MPRKHRTPRARAKPTPSRLRRTTRRRNLVVLAVGLALLVVLARLDHLGLLYAPGSDFDRYHGQTFTVLRIVDGDTLIIDAPDPTRSPTTPHTRVRLWGIDAPETAKPQRGLPAERGADAATAYLQALALDQPVTLHLETHRPRGRFGRLLAHATLTPAKPTDTARRSSPDDDPQHSLSHQLVAAGLARADDTWPHRFVAQLQTAEDHARGQQLGLWSRSETVTAPEAKPEKTRESPTPLR